MKLLVPLVVLLSLAPLLPLPVASAATVDAATWGAPGAPVQASPGDTARPLSVSIRNSDLATYTNVRAAIGAVGPLAPATGGDAAALAGSFAPGDVFVAKFFVNIGADAKIGQTYGIPLTLSETVSKTTTTQTESLTVAVALTGRPALVLSADPATLTANETRDVRVNVTNAGDGPAGSVTLSVAPGSGGLALVRTEGARSLGAIAPGQTRSATFTVRAPGSGGAASLSAQLAYADAAGQSAAEPRAIYFDVASATAPPRDDVSVALAQDHLDSGRPGALDFTVTNGMGGAMSGALFSLDAGASTSVQTVGATDTQVLGDVAPGASRAVRVDVVTANGATGILKLTARLSWTAADGSARSQAYSFGVVLMGTVDIQLSGASSSVASAGTAIVTGTLTNLGNALAHNAYVTLLGGGGYAPTDATYLGDINPNTALPFTLTTTATNATNASGAFPGFGGNGTSRGGVGNGTRGGFANGTRGGGFAGGSQVLFRIQWNDDYGTLHEVATNATIRARASSAATTGAAGATSAGSRLTPAPSLAIVAGALGLAVLLVRRRRV